MDKAQRGNKLTQQRRMGRAAGPSKGRGEKRKGYRVDESISPVAKSRVSPVAKSRVIDRMKEEAKALGGSFFTAAEMEAKIKKMKKKNPYGG